MHVYVCVRLCFFVEPSGPWSDSHRYSILSLPFNCDPYLKLISEQMIEKPNSLTTCSTYKPMVKDLFTQNRPLCYEDVKISKDIKDFAYAPQRYNSEAK